MRIIHIPPQLTDAVIDSSRAVNHTTPCALGLIVAALAGHSVPSVQPHVSVRRERPDGIAPPRHKMETFLNTR